MKKKSILYLVLFSLINVFILFEACLPSSSSSSQSGSLFDIFNNIIQSISGDKYNYVQVEDIKLTGLDEVEVGKTIKCNVDVLPKKATYPAVKYENLTPDVIFVNQFGYVTGLKEGMGTFKVISEDNNEVFQVYNVTVLKATLPIIDKIEILNKPSELKNKMSYRVTTNVSDMSRLVLKSSNESIATFVDGVIKTYQPGNVTLKVESKDNINVYDEINIFVKDEQAIIPEIINLEMNDVIYVNRKVETKISFDQQVDDENVEYIFSSPELVKVDKEIFGKKEGKTKVKVCRLFDKQVCSNEIEIEVKNVLPSSLNIVINGQETELISGKRLQLKVSFEPVDVTNKNIEWSVDDSEVAKISENGMIVGLKTQPVRVKATHKETGMSVERTFDIKKASTFTEHEKATIHGLIRKIIGHFSLFALDGAIGYLFFSSLSFEKKKQHITLLSIGVGVAIFSELLQLFPKGRSCQVSDMIINIAGYIIGALIILLAIKIFKKKRERENKKMIDN